MSKELHDYGLIYSPLQKKYFSFVRVVEHFIPYILSTPVKAYVLYPPIKMILSQQVREGRWSNWLEKLQEFDIKVRPPKVVKGEGLYKLISGINVVNLSPEDKDSTQNYQSDWYKYLVPYLHSGQFTMMMSSREKRALKMKENPYVIISRILFSRNFDGVLLRCFLFQKDEKTLKDMDEGTY